jgi:hypothetical protein
MASAKSKKKSKAHRGEKLSTIDSTARTLPLSGFQPVMWPTVFPAKLVYSDYRTVTCASSQAEYVYRLNSVFDPDQTGVGGQPDGYDQLKVLYGRYRVIAVGVEVECIGQSASGLIAIAPSDTPGPFVSAEEVAGLRYAKAAAFSSTQRGTVRAMYHIGKLLGYSDEAVLANSNLDAAISANPTFQQYLIVAVEGGTSATQVQNVWVKMTYYVRMEVPIAVLDSTRIHRARMRLGSLTQPEEGEKDASSGVVATVPVQSSATTSVACVDDLDRASRLLRLTEQFARVQSLAEGTGRSGASEGAPLPRK